MNEYQAVYDAVRDAVRSSIGTCDLTEMARQAFDTSTMMELAHEAIGRVAYEMTRPSVIYHPVLSQDGDSWIALYGDDLQIGVVGCGTTPEAAMAAFDQTWTNGAAADAAEGE